MKKISLLAVVFVLFNACTKEGPVGPQGPQGPPGYNGTNANVVGTNTFTANWLLNGTIYTDSLIAPGITSDVVDRGSVQVFIHYGSEWWALPDINSLGNSGAVNTTMYGFGVGYLKIWNSNSDGTIPSNPYPPVNEFRAVIISPSARMANPHVNWTKYEEVKKAMHLPD